jgi:hypothetical protein
MPEHCDDPVVATLAASGQASPLGAGSPVDFGASATAGRGEIRMNRDVTLVAATGGAGLVSPGNSPGILTAGSLDPSGPRQSGGGIRRQANAPRSSSRCRGTA